MKRREDAQGLALNAPTRTRSAEPPPRSEKPPATALMQNDHGTRICRVVPRRVERRIARRDKSASRPLLSSICEDQQGARMLMQMPPTRTFPLVGKVSAGGRRKGVVAVLCPDRASPPPHQSRIRATASPCGEARDVARDRRNSSFAARKKPRTFARGLEVNREETPDRAGATSRNAATRRT
jgi:hypothetical protein